MGQGDVVEIGGAGPAGLAAAIVLARRGRRVRVLEQAGVVGRRFHDDFQGMENWTTARDAHEELRAFGIEPTWWHHGFYDGELFDATDTMARVRAPLPLFYCVRRGPQNPGSLDNALLRQAQEAGVEVCYGRKASPEAVHLFAGGPAGRPMAIARGLNFPTRHRDVGCQVLSNALTPGGYVYFVVAEGRATLGTVLVHRFGDSRARLRSAVQAIERLYGIQVPADAEPWGGYACFTLQRSGHRGGTLYAGEAAGIQDALFGFGIRSSLLSGALAGAALAPPRDAAHARVASQPCRLRTHGLRAAGLPAPDALVRRRTARAALRIRRLAAAPPGGAAGAVAGRPPAVVAAGALAHSSEPVEYGDAGPLGLCCATLRGSMSFMPSQHTRWSNHATRGMRNWRDTSLPSRRRIRTRGICCSASSSRGKVRSTQ